MSGYIFACVLATAAATFALRAAPFLLLRGKEGSPVVRLVATLMPPGVMVILVLYGLATTEAGRIADFIPPGAGIAVTVAAYHWRRNALVGILAGTLAYMALLRVMG